METSVTRLCAVQEAVGEQRPGAGRFAFLSTRARGCAHTSLMLRSWCFQPALLAPRRCQCPMTFLSQIYLEQAFVVLMVLISSVTLAFNFLYHPVLLWKIQCEFLTTADPAEKGQRAPAPG